MLSDVVADQIRRQRKRLEINRDQLADRCAALGAPKLTAAAITNIETGRPTPDGVRRREISVDEVVVLGRALELPPILLMFPLGLAEYTEVLPGDMRPTWGAVQWFAGMASYPDAKEYGDDGIATWRKGAAPVDLYRSHDAWSSEWLEHQHEERSERAVLARARIHLTRRTMRQLGLRVPPLPEGMTDDFGEAGMNVLARGQVDGELGPATQAED